MICNEGIFYRRFIKCIENFKRRISVNIYENEVANELEISCKEFFDSKMAH